MSTTALSALIGRCRARCRPRSPLADAELLRRFTQMRDASAFEELLERHAGLVWGVCRRVLPDEADCEDAFQATFLALVRRGHAVEAQPSLGAWLHTVALRVARRAQARRRRQQPLSAVPEHATPADGTGDVSSRELFRLVDEEVERLPAALRLPLVLCCLQGRTRDEAAEALGCSVAAVKSRLERGRGLLRRRLERRGVALPAALLALGLTGERVRAALWDATVRAALSAPAPAVAALAEAAAPGATAGKWKFFLAALLLASGAAGVADALRAGKAPEPPAAAAAEPDTARAAPARTDRHGDPLPDGAVARLGTVRWRHGYHIGRLVYSPDGRMIAATGFGQAVTLWDTASGRLVHKFPLQSQPSSGITFSPDGTLLAAGDWQACHLWDVATGKEVRRLKADRRNADSLAFSADGKTVACVDLEGTLRLWDVANGAELRRVDCKQGVLWAVAFSPDGRRLATGGTDGSVCLWDANNGRELHRLKEAQGRGVTRILFSPDGKRMFSSGMGSDETVHEWDPETGRPVRDFGERRRGRLPVALSGDGTLLASGEFDGEIGLWDTASGREKQHWSAGNLPLWAVAFSPDGKTLASAGNNDSGIRFWDVATGRERHPPHEHVGPVPILRYSADGKTLVSVGADDRMLWWDLAEQLPRREFAWSTRGEEHAFALSADGGVLADASALPPRARTEPPIRLWDVRAGKPLLKLGDGTGRPSAVAVSPDGGLVAAGNEDSSVTLWDTRDGKVVREFRASAVRCLCFSPDGKALAAGLWKSGGGTGGGTLRLWDVAGGQERCAFDVRETLTGVAFSPDGKVLACGNGYRQDAFVTLWDAGTGAELCRHEGHRDSSGAIAFSPDGKLVASGSGSLAWTDKSVHVWEAATGRLIRRFTGHAGDVAGVAFSPDGLSVASGGGDSTILLWDVTGLRPAGRWPGRHLDGRELEDCWAALADADPAKAYDAVWILAAAPGQTVPFLRGQLKPVPRADEKAVARLIADLDSDDFRVRETATRELGKLGDAVAHALRRALAGKPGAEADRRLRVLLDQARAGSPGRLREHRAVQALEHAGTGPAREVLRALAGGAPEARCTEEAKDALRRLGGR